MSFLAKPAIAGALLCALSCSKTEVSPARSASPPESAASAQRADQTDPTAEQYQMPQLPRARVILHDAYGGAHALDAEVAESDESRTRGMMWRRELALDKGMLFIFPDEQIHTMWMRNTLIPLDLIFISAEKTIVGIVPQAAPKTLTSRSVGAPSKYVLEVAGGWCEKFGVRGGSVEIERR